MAAKLFPQKYFDVRQKQAETTFFHIKMQVRKK